MNSTAMLAKSMFAPLALALSLGGLTLATGCEATVPPPELNDARAAYQQAAAGPAAQTAPRALARAREALRKADRAFAEDPDDRNVRDLAYVAEREAELAMAEANTIMAQEGRAEAQRQYAGTLEQMRRQGQVEMQAQRLRAQAQLEAQRRMTQAQIEAQRRMTQAQIEAQRREWQAKVEAAQREAEAARRDADAARLEAQRLRTEQSANQARAAAAEATRAEALARAEEALEDLSDIARLREEQRGTVVTVSSDILFPFNQAALLPDARDKLVPLVDALRDTGREAIVEGHTDNVGAEDFNRELSYKRAMAVRDFLVQHGIPARRLQVLGVGIANPVGDNNTPEGRALNRRVDIIILKAAQGRERTP